MRTYMCYTCNGDFERGYWLNTGESEELFYCDAHAAEAGITESEDARRHLPYSGYSISTGFLAGNLFNESGDDGGTYDEAESAQKYAIMCREAIEKEYPGAEVEVDYQLNAGGATPTPLRTWVSEPEDAGALDNDRIAEHVDEICNQVWESWEWVVYEGA